jgi:PAS domain S-box-containing protein
MINFSGSEVVNKELKEYKHALDVSSIVAITDSKGIIIHANENFCSISKYSKEELLGQNHNILNSNYHPQSFFIDLWKTISMGKIWKGDVKNLAKDGTYYWVDTTIIPFLDENNKPFQYLAIRNDITQKKRMELKLLKINSELEEKIIERTKKIQLKNDVITTQNINLNNFTHIVTHDLRSPLGNIKSLLELLNDSIEDKLLENDKELIHLLNTSVLKMDNLIIDLLNHSKTDWKNLKITEIITNELVNNICKDVMLDYPNKIINWNLKTLDNCFADSVLIKQVWMNYILNAVKFSLKKDIIIIEIGSYKENDKIVFYIKDNGAGFEPSKKEKLFKVFQRLHADSDFYGNGVGLSTVKKIITKHNGEVWAESDVNNGATFYFSLPIL